MDKTGSVKVEFVFFNMNSAGTHLQRFDTGKSTSIKAPVKKDHIRGFLESSEQTAGVIAGRLEHVWNTYVLTDMDRIKDECFFPNLKQTWDATETVLATVGKKLCMPFKDGTDIAASIGNRKYG